MALGLAGTRRQTLMMGAAIGIHQPAESLALLVALLKGGLTQRRTAQLLACFSLVGPSGFIVGTMLKRLAPAKVAAALVAMTAGTFIYVGATEVVAGEFEDAR